MRITASAFANGGGAGVGLLGLRKAPGVFGSVPGPWHLFRILDAFAGFIQAAGFVDALGAAQDHLLNDTVLLFVEQRRDRRSGLDLHIDVFVTIVFNDAVFSGDALTGRRARRQFGVPFRLGNHDRGGQFGLTCTGASGMAFSGG